MSPYPLFVRQIGWLISGISLDISVNFVLKSDIGLIVICSRINDLIYDISKFEKYLYVTIYRKIK